VVVVGHKRKIKMDALLIACTVLFGIAATLLFMKNHTQRKQLAELKEMATTDLLTGVRNRHFMSKWLSAKSSPEADVFFIDICDFKQINDTRGHYNGDLALRAVADVLAMTFPDGTIIRWGGDEFVVFTFTHCRDEGVPPAKPPHTVHMLTMTVKLHVGYAYKRAGSSLLKAIERANMAMLDNKKNKDS
jgi:diguanylate cyclase (GGDEF)-like protein